ncbi:Uncharacterised protein [Mycobacteroides abscessus subsp. abscessus]|nr:Uncharacterised protein [Mycobacteroides abscessus subsp. abscessus]
MTAASSQVMSPAPGIAAVSVRCQVVRHCSGKQRRSASSMIGTAVDAPGEAPSSPAML